ncbi:MAG: hypothetical protein HYY68_00990 [Thaumarchaeota archaeon]|nr:hypothetical protein [Nitrososphaerota archaeon]MBI3022284.1 hypothetical protein [Nitrososphaerota archaeon]
MAIEHEFKLRVRYEETDTMQVVHYSKYATTTKSDVNGSLLSVAAW